MERNSRPDGLSYDAIFVNGRPIRRNLLKPSWSKLARACYERGCNCNNCDLIPKDKLDSLYKCQVKYYVMGYIQMGYEYKEDYIKNEYGQETQKCKYYDSKKCKLTQYKGNCVICKGQFCMKYIEKDLG